MITETEADTGIQSSMRKTVQTARRIGVFMIIYGAIIIGYMALTNSRYELLTAVSLLIGTGGGLITGVSLAKAWQAQHE